MTTHCRPKESSDLNRLDNDPTPGCACETIKFVDICQKRRHARLCRVFAEALTLMWKQYAEQTKKKNITSHQTEAC